MKMKKVVAALAALAMCASPNFAMAASEMGGALVAVAEQSAVDTDHASCFPEAYCTDANTYSYAFAPNNGAGNYGA